MNLISWWQWSTEETKLKHFLQLKCFLLMILMIGAANKHDFKLIQKSECWKIQQLIFRCRYQANFINRLWCKQYHFQNFNLMFSRLTRTTWNIKALNTRKGQDSIIIRQRKITHRIPCKNSRLYCIFLLATSTITWNEVALHVARRWLINFLHLRSAYQIPNVRNF